MFPTAESEGKCSDYDFGRNIFSVWFALLTVILILVYRLALSPAGAPVFGALGPISSSGRTDGAQPAQFPPCDLHHKQIYFNETYSGNLHVILGIRFRDKEAYFPHFAEILKQGATKFLKDGI